MTTLILGGGIGGLSTAHYLLKSPTRKVILVETSNRVGGWIRSEKHDGVVLEQGPRTLRPRGEAGANTLDLIHDLGLNENLRPIKLTDVAARNRFVYVNGKLHKLPSGLSSLISTVPPFSKPLAYAALNDWKNKHNLLEDDSIYNFVRRRFGQEVADYAISPLICGICGGDAKKISVHFLLSDLFKREQKYGSITKSLLRPWTWTLPSIYGMTDLSEKARVEKWSSYAFADGLEILPQILKTRIVAAGGDVRTSCKPINLNLKEKVLTLQNDDKIKFDHVVGALPPNALAKILDEECHSVLADLLEKIEYASIVTVNLVYKKKLIRVDGFGFLVPPSENLPLLGEKYLIFTSYEVHMDKKHNSYITELLKKKYYE